jgi:hypothetical protein
VLHRAATPAAAQDDGEVMEIRHYLDEETGQPHAYNHGVGEDEVADVLRKPLEEYRGRGNSMIAVGQTRVGRYLRVVYSPDDDGEGIFVITAYDVPPRQIRALRRRLRRRSP